MFFLLSVAKASLFRRAPQATYIQPGQCTRKGNADYLIKVTAYNFTINISTANLKTNYSFDLMTSEFPTKFDFEIPDGLLVYLDNKSVVDNTIEYKFPQLDYNTTVNLTITDNCTTWETKIDSMAPDFPLVTCEGEIPYDGYILADVLSRPQLRGHIYKADKQCNILMYRSQVGLTGDFKYVKNSKGEGRYIFNYADVTHPPRTTSYGWTKYAITDLKYNTLKTLSMVRHGNISEDHFPTQSHDMYYFDDNHFFVDTYYPLVTKLPGREGNYEVLTAIIEEVIDDKVVMWWNSSDYPELYTSSECDYSTNWPNDHMHTNTLQIDPTDNSLIASFRLQSTVIKINRTTGKTIWYLGGEYDNFGLTIDEKSSMQHYAHFDNGELLMFDNGNRNETTHIMLFTLDEQNMTVKQFTSYTFPYNSTRNRFSEYCGSVQRTAPNQFWIAWGKYDHGGSPSLGDCAVSLEDVAQNKTLFKMKLQDDRPNYRSVFVFDEKSNDNKNKMLIYIIVGAVAGGVALIVIIVCCIACRKGKSGDKKDSIQTMNTLLE